MDVMLDGTSSWTWANLKDLQRQTLQKIRTNLIMTSILTKLDYLRVSLLQTQIISYITLLHLEIASNRTNLNLSNRVFKWTVQLLGRVPVTATSSISTTFTAFSFFHCLSHFVARFGFICSIDLYIKHCENWVRRYLR